MTEASYQIKEGLPALEFGGFIGSVSRALPGIVSLLHDREVAEHPVWGHRIPFHVEPYGIGSSVGHIVRPDVVWTQTGPMICELDFVPAGRGLLLSSGLECNRRERFLEVFRVWYESMGFSRVLFATASKEGELYRNEIELFARALRACGVSISWANIELVDSAGALVDRLFYRSEMNNPLCPIKGEVITKEPFLDSKMIFALIHAPEMEPVSLKHLGQESLRFLRSIFPRTYALEEVRNNETLFREVCGNRGEWVLKNTDVETSSSWGARGVMVGKRFTGKVWGAALEGLLTKKNLGRYPIVQRFVQSLDFSQMWDAGVGGDISLCDPGVFGLSTDPIVREKARKEVTARVGMFFLMDNVRRRVLVPDTGLITLRQDPLAHGASDAVFTALVVE